jgi:hypothetical protein
MGGSKLKTTGLPQLGHVIDTVISSFIFLLNTVSNQSHIRQRECPIYTTLSLL